MNEPTKQYTAAEVLATVAIWRIRTGGMELSQNEQAPHLLRLILCEDVRIILERDADDTAEQAAAMRELARLATEAAEDLESRKETVAAAALEPPGPGVRCHGCGALPDGQHGEDCRRSEAGDAWDGETHQGNL